MKNEVNAVKLSRDTAKVMFPAEYAIGEFFENRLKELITVTLEKNKGQEERAFSMITAVMSMELAKMFAIADTNPTSVIKAFCELLLDVYKKKLELLKEQENKHG